MYTHFCVNLVINQRIDGWHQLLTWHTKSRSRRFLNIPLIKGYFCALKNIELHGERIFSGIMVILCIQIQRNGWPDIDHFDCNDIKQMFACKRNCNHSMNNETGEIKTAIRKHYWLAMMKGILHNHCCYRLGNEKRNQWNLNFCTHANKSLMCGRQN